MEQASDEALMEQFRKGDEAAFTALHERHGPKVHRYLKRLTGNDAIAQELTQAAFFSLVVSRGRYKSGAPLRPWLYAIATNAARDFFRKHKNEVLEAEPGMDETVDPPATDPGLERAVKRALAELPDDQREAIVLHRFEGLSFAEVAVAVGASEAAVRVRAHRGYEKLRVSLKTVWEAGQ